MADTAMSDDSTVAHTPGPWMVEDPMGDGVGDALWIVAEGASPEVYDWRCVAIVTSDDPADMDGSASKPISAAERDANARLIAAAPELLEALDKYADDLCEGWCEQSPDCAHFEDCAGCLARRTAWRARGSRA